MTTKTVEELMTPLSEYATVSQDATLKEAIIALENVQKAFDKNQYQHRAVLVYNELNYIVGKVGQLDVLRALEPKYESMGAASGIARFGFSSHFMKSMFEHYKLFDSPMEKLTKRAASLKVKEFMHTPTEGEFVNKKASVNEAIHSFVMGQHQSLLVVSEKQIVGILRLVDVFKEISNEITKSGE